MSNYWDGLPVGQRTAIAGAKENVPGDVQVYATNLGNGQGVVEYANIPGGPTATAATSLSTIQTNLTTRLAVVETWITNNPSGATLNAAQTLVLMRGIAGLIRLLLGQTSTFGGA